MADSLAGYTICKGTELEITIENMKYAPHYRMNIYPILGISQAGGMMKV